MTHPDPASWRVGVDSATASIVRLRLTAVPGWHATIDGRPWRCIPWASGLMLEARCRRAVTWSSCTTGRPPSVPASPWRCRAWRRGWSWPRRHGVVLGRRRRARVDVAVSARRARLDVVVVAYGPPDALARALGRVCGDAYPAVVVDNSSSPATAAVAADAGARYVDPGAEPRVRGRREPGARQHLADPARDVLLLNPDARIDAGRAGAPARELLDHPGVACVAPAQHVPGSTDPRAGRVGHGTPRRERGPRPSGLAGRRLRSSRYFLGGAVLLVRKAALADVGGFDERFFLYSEDEDWQRRAVPRGWRVRFCPEVGPSTARGGPRPTPCGSASAPRRDRALHPQVVRTCGLVGVPRRNAVRAVGLRLLVRRGPPAPQRGAPGPALPDRSRPGRPAGRRGPRAWARRATRRTTGQPGGKFGHRPTSRSGTSRASSLTSGA